MTRPRLPRAAPLALALVGPLGCHAWRPVTPLRGGDGRVTLEATALRAATPVTGREAVLTLRVVRADFRRIAAARLNPLSAPECGGSLNARSIRVRGAAGQELPTQALGEEARSVDLSFAQAELGEVLGREPGMVDVSLAAGDRGGEAGCVRVPLLPAPDRVNWAEEPLWHLGAAARAFWLPRSSHGLDSGWMVVGRGGVFAGPVRLGIEAGAGRGGADPAATFRGFRLYGGALRLETLLGSVPLGSRAALGLDGEAGYEVVAAEGAVGVETTGIRWAFHGPRAALRVALFPSAPAWYGFRSRRDAGSLGLELYGARWWSRGADPAWVLGVGLGGHLPL